MKVFKLKQAVSQTIDFIIGQNLNSKYIRNVSCYIDSTRLHCYLKESGN